MQYTSIIAALMASSALAAPISSPSAPVKRGTGMANIHNNCAWDIKVLTSANGADHGTDTIPAGTTWSKPQMNFGGAGAGVSLKVNKVDAAEEQVAQFEYTVSDAMALVFYDLSLINGNPFGEWEQTVSSGGVGPEVKCAAGETPCAGAYTWAEQVATKAVAAGTDLDYYVCGSSQ